MYAPERYNRVMRLGSLAALVLLLAACPAEGAADGDTDAVGSSDGDAPPLMHGAANGQCVEHGMRFVDVFSCEGVLGPTPTQPPGATAKVDPRPDTPADPDYAWVVAQTEACACTCCHSSNGVGTYRWANDFVGAWTDSADDEVLDILGFTGGPNAFDPADNFGFSRTEAALPTTDAARLQGFIDRELARRGR